MALAVSNNMTAYGTGDTGELIDVASGAGWYDLDNLHADFGRLSSIISVTADFYEGASGVEGCVGTRPQSGAITVGMVYYDGSTTIDMSGTMYVRVTVKYSEVSKMGTQAQGGIQIIVMDSGGDYATWSVSGSDNYSGDWEQYLVDVSSPRYSESATAPTMTDIIYVGVCSYYPINPARAENQFIDAQWYGSDPSITVTGTATTTGDGWSELESVSQAVTTRYGPIRLRNGVYEIRGGIKFGDAAGTGSVDFSDNTNAKVFFQPTPTGALDVNKITLQGNATGTTDFQLGTLVGTGDDRQGILGGVINTLGDRFEFDAETDTSDIDSCELYGTVFEGAGNIKLSGSTTQEAFGCQFIKCDEVQPNDAEFLNNKIISPSPDRGLEFATNSVIKQIDFIAGSTDDQPATQAWQVDTGTPDVFTDLTEDFNDAGTLDVLPFPATEAIGDYFTVGYTSKFAKLRIDTGTARSGGTLVWEYWSGAAWSTLTTTDGTNTLSTTGLQDVTFTPPTDWAAYTVNDENATVGDNRPMFNVRLRVTATMTTNPVLDQGYIADVVEHHLHYPDATKVNGYAATDLQFFGGGAAGSPKWHGENSETRNTVTAGSFVVNQWYEILTAGTTDFTLIGSADNVVGTHFKATGIGSGTGTAFDVLGINSSGTTNIAANEIDNTGATAGDVEVVSSVPLTITVKDKISLVVIQNVQTSIHLKNSPFTQLMNEDTNASGVATEDYGGTTGVDIVWKCRKSEITDNPRYFADSGIETITADGLNLTVLLDQNPFI